MSVESEDPKPVESEHAKQVESEAKPNLLLRLVQWIWKKIGEWWKWMFRPHKGPRWGAFCFSVVASIVVVLFGYFVLGASSVILALPPRNGPLDKADVIAQLFTDE